MRILVVDDKADNTELLTQMLEDLYEIQPAHSGKECLEAAAKYQPDLIILDVMMPEMDGYEVLRRLKQDTLTENIPVVFLTAKYRDIDRVVKGLELGAIDYITKPVEEDELLARIKSALRIKQAEDRIRMQNIELKAINDELRALGYSVSHDLRAPLRHIDGLSRILLEDHSAFLDDEAKDYLNRIINANNHMRTCLEDLLNLSKVSSTQFSPQRVNLSECAQDIVDDFMRSQTGRNISVEIQPEITTLADKSLLHLILLNLIDNALKFSGKQSHPLIKIGLINDKGRTYFYVTDNGVGFDMSNSQRLFAPFQRFHDTSEFEGTGIGLAIVQRAVNRHGGTVWAQSEPGHGCTFYFTLSPSSSMPAQSVVLNPVTMSC